MTLSSMLAKLGDRVLLAGCGGGYDVLGAVPLWHALRAHGAEVHFASLSFCYLNGLDGARQDSSVPNLYAVTATAATERAYCPEAQLARFLDTETGRDDHVIWSFDKTGVAPLRRAYASVIERFGIDAIVLVDGGIDALLRGDETSLGTPSEDLASLAAATSLGVPVTLACVGMSAELRDGIAHEQVFERIAELTRAGAFRGAHALAPGTAACDTYVRAVEFVFAAQATQKRSHVHKVIVESLRGHYGTVAPHVYLSALLHLYWYFDALEVARSHCFLAELADTESIWDVVARIEAIRPTLAIKPRTAIPI